MERAGFPISGAGGGGGKKGGGSSADNTLQSRARVRMTFLVSEGEIEEIDNIYIDGTPLIAEDGSRNFEGVSYEVRTGLPDQEHFTGSPFVETPHVVESEVTKANGQVIRTVTEENADSVRVIVRIPALFSVGDGGKLQTTNLSYQVKVRPSGGVWQVVHSEHLRREKCTSPVQMAHRVPLPAGGWPWDIAVERITDDSESAEDLQNATIFESYTSIVEGKFTYPHSALVYVEIDAEQFGSRTPTISFSGKFLKTLVPSNYDPVARTYAGIWDGTFKTAWHRNGPWVLYDLIVNNRYGLGEFVELTTIDKMSFYQIGQYADQLVPSGYKDENGADIMEPRFSFDGVINTREKAFDLLRRVAASFRGMTFWSLGQIFAVADMPEDPKKLVTPANVERGRFIYSGSSLDARHSVALVKYNDRNDHGAQATELVINDRMLAEHGWREKPVETLGKQSPGEAVRVGRWILDTEEHETETVSYTAGWDHADFKPFQIVAIADPRKAGFRTGGRVKEATTGSVTLDAPFERTVGLNYQMMATLPTGAVETRDVASFVEDAEGKAIGVTLAAPLSDVPAVNSVWIITGLDAAPRQFRVLNVKEIDAHAFRVTGLFHDPTKYPRIEQGVKVEPVRYTRPQRSIAKPINLDVRENLFFENGAPRSVITVSWTPGADFMSMRFAASARTPRGWIDLGETQSPSIEIHDVLPGEYLIRIIALGYNGLRSMAAEVTYAAQGWDAAAAPRVENLRLDGQAAAGIFTTRDCAIRWDTVFSAGPQTNPFFERSTVAVYDNSDPAAPALLRTETVLEAHYTYTFHKNAIDGAALGRGPTRNLKFVIILFDTLGRQSLPAELVASNPPVAAPTVSVTAGFGQIFVSLEKPDEPDIEGAVIAISTETGFDPALIAPAYRGPNTAYVHPVDGGTTCYVRVGCYDGFSTEPVNWSSEFSATAIENVVDLEPPVTPVGLALSTRVDLLPDGTSRIILAALWTANGEADLAGYDVELKEGTGNFIGFQTNTNSYEWVVKSSVSYSVRLRARDRAGNVSVRTAAVAITAAGDTVAPGVPANLVAKAGFETFWLTWDELPDADMSHYELVARDGAYAPGVSTVPDYTSTAATFVLAGQGNAVTRHFWVRGVDRSGNKGPWSAKAQATTPTGATVTAEQLAGLVNATSFAQGISGVGIGNALPAITAMTPKAFFKVDEGVLYRQNANGSGWTADTDATRIVGQLIAGQIGAGAVGTEELASRAILAKHVYLTDFANLIPNGNWTSDWQDHWGANGLSISPHFTTTPSYTRTGERSLVLQKGTLTESVNMQMLGVDGNCIPVTEGAPYYFETEVKTNSGATAAGFFFRVRWYGAALTYIGYDDIARDMPVVSGWTIYSKTVTAPAGARLALIQIYNHDTSTASNIIIDRLVMRAANAAKLVVDGEIIGRHLATDTAVITVAAQIAQAIISDAHILNLSAAKLKAGTALTNTLTVSGTVLSNIEWWARDPAARINAATTQVDPGRIFLSAGRTLGDWRYGGDFSLFNGSMVAAGTLQANAAVFGQRNLIIEGIEFEHNKPAFNQVSWTAGTIRYIGDDGNIHSFNVAAGSTSYAGAPLYIVFRNTDNTIRWTADVGIIGHPQHVVLAIYRGDKDLVTDYGRTVIDGANVKTGTLDASVAVKARTIIGDLIAFQTMKGEHFQSNSVNTGHLAVGLGKNALYNASFTMGMDGWIHSPASGQTASDVQFELRPLGQSWSGTTTPTLMVIQPNANTAGYTDVYNSPPGIAGVGSLPVAALAVQAGDVVEASVYASAHRCRVELRIRWLDVNGVTVVYTGGAVNDAVSGDSTNPERWPRLVHRAVAPAGAVAAAIHIRKTATQSGQTNSYMFVHKPLLAKTVAGATEAMPWSDGTITMIGPNGIVTNGVKAHHIEVDSLAAISGVFGNIEAEWSNVQTAITGSFVAESANIGLLSVDTLRLAHGSVSNIVAVTAGTTPADTAVSVTINRTANTKVIINAFFEMETIYSPGNRFQKTRYDLRRGATQLTYEEFYNQLIGLEVGEYSGDYAVSDLWWGGNEAKSYIDTANVSGSQTYSIAITRPALSVVLQVLELKR